MSQPPAYNRTSSFATLQTTNPTGQPPGQNLDVEYNNIKTTLDQVLANLALIQRDDGALANASVGLNQLSTALNVGFSVPTAWVTGHSYVASPASTVFNGGKFYSCLVSHTSGTFATDLAAVKWVLIADLTVIPLVAANQIAVTASGLLTTDVQGSLQALDAGKAATSHTHPSSALTDGTAAGRAMFAAATAAAQRTLLSLGALALLDTIPVTAITAQLALTGVILPAALVASTNDWSPTGWATATRVRVSATSAINITGLAATTDGDIKILENTGAFVITLTNLDASSAAANRLVTNNFVLSPNTCVTLMYDATPHVWVLVSGQRLVASSAQATALADNTVTLTPSTFNQAAAAYVIANPATTNPYGLQLLHIQDQKTANTGGGTFTTGAWRTRDLNTVVTNQITGASLGSNQITLPAGTYDVDAIAPARGVTLHKAKLKNITDSTDALIGSSEESNNAVGYMTHSFVRGRIVIAAQKVFEIQHQSSATGTFGTASNFAVIEVYADIKIRKVA